MEPIETLQLIAARSQDAARDAVKAIKAARRGQAVRATAGQEREVDGLVAADLQLALPHRTKHPFGGVRESFSR